MRNVSGGVEAEELRRGVTATTLRACAGTFSILINANNELFSVWLGARTRRAQPHHLLPRIAVQTIVSVPPRHSPTTPRTPLPRNHPIAPSRNSPVANHRAGSTPMNTSHDIDFDGTLVSLFFLHHVPLSSFRNSHHPIRSRVQPISRSLFPSSSFALF